MSYYEALTSSIISREINKTLLQHTIWPDLKAHVSYLFVLQDINATTSYEWWKLMQKQAPANWVGLIPPQKPMDQKHTRIVSTNGHKTCTTQYLVTTITSVQSKTGGKYERISISYDPRTDLDNCSAEKSKDFGIGMNIIMQTSRFTQIYRRTEVNGRLDLNANFTSLQ